MVSHQVNPLEIHSILIYEIDSSFAATIEDYYISNSFENNLITATSYTMIYNEQDINKLEDFRFVRVYLEFAGNTLNALSKPLNLQKEDDAYQLFGTRYSQYAKSDVDLRYYDIINKDNSVVYRFFIGAGYPYGNAIAMPFEKKYFVGGANSIRAWQVRSLGPGSYVEEDQIFANQMADLKLELNIEYRFAMFWVLEGALFVDAGNIWAISPDDDRPGAILKLDEFYKETAVGTGVGARLDFSFFIFRLDLGIKTIDPAQPEGERWVLTGSNLSQWDSYGLNFGIGYPF
jgi:outer membrane protein assembly factor BamA